MVLRIWTFTTLQSYKLVVTPKLLLARYYHSYNLRRLPLAQNLLYTQHLLVHHLCNRLSLICAPIVFVFIL
nr:MAG TPA: hypothetical protein [Caudoviricetes sp.]